MSLAHNGSGVFGAKRLFLAFTNCVKAFRSKFKAISFQVLHWLQKLGQTGVVGMCIQLLNSTNMKLH